MLIYLTCFPVFENPGVESRFLLMGQVQVVLDRDKVAAHLFHINNIVCLLCAYVDYGKHGGVCGGHMGFEPWSPSKAPILIIVALTQIRAASAFLFV